MSDASDTFVQSIQDAENLLKHFNARNTKPPPPEIEVLKRAGLIMAMTAWETYVEDRLQEALVLEQLRSKDGEREVGQIHETEGGHRPPFANHFSRRAEFAPGKESRFAKGDKFSKEPDRSNGKGVHV